MRRAISSSIVLFALALPLRGQQAAASRAQGKQVVDRIAARIEDDIVLESEVRELAAYQQLVNGSAERREKLIGELFDQWIVRTEAETARFPRPPEDEVNRQVTQLQQPSESRVAFHMRLALIGLNEGALRRIVAQQIYLARFLDYKFRPAAQVDAKKIEAYYRGQFAKQMAARGQTTPPLEDVQEQIRELLTQSEINDRATRWLDETKARLKIDVTPGGSGS